MSNTLRIDGDTVLILVVRRGGQEFTILVDASALPLVSKYRWMVIRKGRNGPWYAVANKGRRGDGQVALHRLVTGAPPGTPVDHKNHNTLDNRRQNLRVVTFEQNAQNRKSANTNNHSSGVRGVTWSKVCGKWLARVKVHYKYYCLGYFTDLREAERVVKAARAALMDCSAESASDIAKELCTATKYRWPGWTPPPTADEEQAKVLAG